MDYEKKRLTPIVEQEPTSDDAAKKESRDQLKRSRSETERFKQRYFEMYDDVKMSHREDW